MFRKTLPTGPSSVRNARNAGAAFVAMSSAAALFFHYVITYAVSVRMILSRDSLATKSPQKPIPSLMSRKC